MSFDAITTSAVRELWRQGKDTLTIAKRLGITEGAAWRIVNAYLDERYAERLAMEDRWPGRNPTSTR